MPRNSSFPLDNFRLEVFNACRRCGKVWAVPTSNYPDWQANKSWCPGCEDELFTPLYAGLTPEVRSQVEEALYKGWVLNSIKLILDNTPTISLAQARDIFEWRRAELRKVNPDGFRRAGR